MDVRGQRPHAGLECVPVGDRELDRAPAYFKKAMLEAESEWSTHHAKAVIETTAKKVGRRSGPMGDARSVGVISGCLAPLLGLTSAALMRSHLCAGLERKCADWLPVPVRPVWLRSRHAARHR